MTEPPNSPPDSTESQDAPAEVTPAIEPAPADAEPQPLPSDPGVPPPPAWVPPSPDPGPAPGLAFGGFWIRFAAYLVDGLIAALIALPLVALIYWQLWALYQIAAFAISIGYFSWFWARGGSTPGMALFGLRVVRDADGGPIGWAKALVRWFGLLISFIVLFIGVIWVAFDQRKRGWHDLMAGTVVVRTPEARSTGRFRLLTIGAAAVGCLTSIIAVVVVVVFSAWLALNLFSNGIRDSNGVITTPQTISVNALRVGDCFDLPDPGSDLVATVHAVPCAQAHVYEVFFTGDMPDGDFPTSDAQASFATDNCTPAFETYVGLAYSDSVWNAFYIGPSEDTWAVGDRTVICQLHNADETPVTGSARNSNQ
jgi:uncharacterized RDD family membrane protein YckC